MSNVRGVTLRVIDLAVFFCPSGLSLGWLSLSIDSPTTNPVNRQPKKKSVKMRIMHLPGPLTPTTHLKLSNTYTIHTSPPNFIFMISYD